MFVRGGFNSVSMAEGEVLDCDRCKKKFVSGRKGVYVSPRGNLYDGYFVHVKTRRVLCVECYDEETHDL